MRKIALFSAAWLLVGAMCATTQEHDIPNVVERVTPAVVSVYTVREGVTSLPFVLPFGGAQPHRFRQEGMGSGVIVSADGHILTNHHVVDRAKEVRVVLTDRREFKGKVLGSDRRTDIALLRVEAKDLPFLPFGDSGKVRVGETVLAVGNPLGVGQTISKGIVSAKGRANVGIVDYEDFLQTDAAINPGNSGGALVNLKGELVGIPTAIASRTGGFQGIGFAIPSNMAREVMEILKRDGKVARGQLGVVVQDMTPALARAMNGAPDRGALVSEVQPGSPAEKAGLKPGDIVRKLDGEAVESVAGLRNRIALKGAGMSVKLDVWREGRELTLETKLRKEEDKAPLASEDRNLDEDGEISGIEGVSVAPSDGGLRVVSIDPARVSPWLGLRQGDVIIEVNRKRVENADDLRRELRKSKDSALLTVRRQGGTLYLALPLDRVGALTPDF